MARLTNKSLTARAPQTAGSVPELPDFDAELAAQPGGQQTNAALQRWWDLVRQRIEFNNGDINSRFQKISADFGDGVNSLQAQITEEKTVRADADDALASSITTLTATVNGISASVTTIQTALATVNNYLEARWTVNVSAGPIVTGMTLFSSSGPNTDVSYIAFQADRFLVNTASGGNKQIFSASAAAVKFGDVMTVDLASAKLYIGTGTYANANTYFYVDTISGGRMSLGSKFVWDGSNLTLTGTITATAGSIGGWTINSSTISQNNAILDSAGQLVLGTANNIIYVSATDATYRIWVGNVTAASAAFSVTKAGVLFATGATISGTITITNPTSFGVNYAGAASPGAAATSIVGQGAFATLSTANYNTQLTNQPTNSAGALLVTVSPSGSGLFLGSDHLGYYTAGAWKTYMDSSGNFYLGGTSGSLQWNGSTLAISGTITSTAGTIGGYTLATTGFTAGSGSTQMKIDNAGGGYLQFGLLSSGPVAVYTLSGISLTTNASVSQMNLDVLSGYGLLRLYTNGGSIRITARGDTGDITATTFTGSGASLTAINASNIASGTIGNGFLPSGISVSTLQSSGATTVGGILTINGTATVNTQINMAGSTKIDFSAASGVSYLQESWGINLWGNSTHPVQINGGSLIYGVAGGSGYGVGNLLNFVIDYSVSASVPNTFQSDTVSGSDHAFASYLKFKGPAGTTVYVPYQTGAP